MAGPARATPFWEQYQRLKARYPDVLLWTRVGDFYELFEEDARIAARELHITLTSREYGKDFRVPLAGVPYHAAESYLARLIRKGYHVAICEQLSEPGRGLVERDVVRVVTPGTLAEPGLLPQRTNNYLAAVLWDGATAGLAYVDVSTGEFAAAEFAGEEAAAALDAELRRLSPAECLTPVGQEEPCALPGARTPRETWQFDAEAAREQLQAHFAAQSLAAFGCEGAPLATACAGAILRYVAQTNPALLPLLSTLRGYAVGAAMQLDGQTRRNLNLTRGAGGNPEGSLLAVLDVCATAIGARLLRRWLGQPLVDLAEIESRQAVVAALVAAPELRAHLRGLLRGVLDVERITGRLASGGATPREVWALARSLQAAHALHRAAESGPPALAALLRELDACDDLAALIAAAVVEPGNGQTIAAGCSAELDALRAASAADRAWIDGLEAAERARTGIKSLKVGFTKVFGYFIEVTNPNRALVPADYVRKQTVAGAERYLTPELKEVEARLLRATEDQEALEGRVFADFLRRLAEHQARLLATAQRLAAVDVFCALAEVAERDRWVMPAVDESADLEIRNGRHPVVERALGADAFIPNDCQVAHDGARLLLITGPNMAGKSTYLRQAALIVLLAQIGSFVPADSARVGLVDRIFTRVGAQDDLAGGASTFMVEMMETAAICRQATARSLVILDEVGRGTSTEDGCAIARAVLEHLHDVVQARTLFATHFRELAAAVDALPHLEPWTFAVLELSSQLAFTHRLTPGVADRSYGLHVARLAGMPSAIIARAEALARAEESRGVRESAVRGQRDGDGLHLRERDGRSLRERPSQRELPCPDVWPSPAEEALDRKAAPALTASGAESALAACAADQAPAPQRVGAPCGQEQGAFAKASVAGADAPRCEGDLALLYDLAAHDVAQTTPIQALLKLSEAQQTARRLLGR